MKYYIWVHHNFENITSFILSPCDLETWLKQNKAEYTGDFLEGCLLDNFMVATKRGFAAIYEHYVNPNESDYRVEFQPGAAQDVFRNWYDFEEVYNNEQI